jgi:hypothetical protein
MHIGIVESQRTRVDISRRIAMPRKGFDVHAVEARDATP